MYCGVKISCDFNRLMQFSKVIDDEICFKYTGGWAVGAVLVVGRILPGKMLILHCCCCGCLRAAGCGRNWHATCRAQISQLGTALLLRCYDTYLLAISPATSPALQST
jgi:hypothetical protein